ncbi:hypothetical protein N790_07085 [Arenimonas malthae CC-JY-1]|uniref:Polysaccharide biosynthesis protein C-terminal domain-containing protein n=1 Tax=Arenimonas malthae CC-JY-1 TaxID=1384054 RepID=A0A091B861_9GAMM|nr:hypothetical protein [Arenimonas malthae]KFN47906.1 hypothetical protein N790_07085 [Arenimonas malthae CC-JY-1]
MLLKLGRHGLLFALAKSAVLVAPILAASLLGVAEYGAVEWWIAMSLIVGPLIGFGAHGVVAYGSVGSQDRRHIRTAVVVVIAASAALDLASVAVLIAGVGGSSLFAPVALQSAVVVLQLTVSARLKGLGRGAWASVAESSLYLSLLAAVGLAWMGSNFVEAYLIVLLVASVGLISVLLSSVGMRPSLSWLERDFRGFVRRGVGYLVGGVLLGLFMSMPRAVLGFAGSVEAVAQFAIAFRWLSIAIVAHQFINTLFFRRLFADSTPGSRDGPLATTVLLVAFAALAVIGLLASGLPSRFGVAIPRPGTLVWLLAAAIVLWSATACMEGALFRVGAIGDQSRAVCAGLLAQIAANLALMKVIDDRILLVTVAWLIGLATMIAGQHRKLRQAGTPLPMVVGVALGGAVVAVSIACLASSGTNP